MLSGCVYWIPTVIAFAALREMISLVTNRASGSTSRALRLSSLVVQLSAAVETGSFVVRYAFLVWSVERLFTPLATVTVIDVIDGCRLRRSANGLALTVR